MTWFSGGETGFSSTRILERWEKLPDHPGVRRRVSPLEEERREVLESVLQAMATTQPDPDRAAACCYLLRHLALGSRRDPLSGGSGGGTACG